MKSASRRQPNAGLRLVLNRNSYRSHLEIGIAAKYMMEPDNDHDEIIQANLKIDHELLQALKRLGVVRSQYDLVGYVGKVAAITAACEQRALASNWAASRSYPFASDRGYGPARTRASSKF